MFFLESKIVDNDQNLFHFCFRPQEGLIFVLVEGTHSADIRLLRVAKSLMVLKLLGDDRRFFVVPKKTSFLFNLRHAIRLLTSELPGIPMKNT